MNHKMKNKHSLSQLILVMLAFFPGFCTIWGNYVNCRIPGKWGYSGGTKGCRSYKCPQEVYEL